MTQLSKKVWHNQIKAKLTEHTALLNESYRQYPCFKWSISKVHILHCKMLLLSLVNFLIYILREENPSLYEAKFASIGPDEGQLHFCMAAHIFIKPLLYYAAELSAIWQHCSNCCVLTALKEWTWIPGLRPAENPRPWDPGPTQVGKQEKKP